MSSPEALVPSSTGVSCICASPSPSLFAESALSVMLSAGVGKEVAAVTTGCCEFCEAMAADNGGESSVCWKAGEVVEYA